jgi:hypothetical protein
MHKEIADLEKTSGYKKILNKKLRAGKRTTPNSCFKKPAKKNQSWEKSSMILNQDYLVPRHLL